MDVSGLRKWELQRAWEYRERCSSRAGEAYIQGTFRCRILLFEVDLTLDSKIMILSIAHDIECSNMWLMTDYEFSPHFPSVAKNMPESPAHWHNEDPGLA